MSLKEIKEVIDVIQPAVASLEKEMGGGASMMQLKIARSLEWTLTIMVKASAISTADATKLWSLWPNPNWMKLRRQRLRPNVCVARTSANEVNPIEKVIQMILDLKTVMMSRLSLTL